MGIADLCEGSAEEIRAARGIVSDVFLTLGRQVPGYVFAADLIAGYSGWTPTDKSAFQRWLAVNVYDLVDWASDSRSTNWAARAAPVRPSLPTTFPAVAFT